MSIWFREYGYCMLLPSHAVSGYPGRLMVGAYPTDTSDVRTLSSLGVTRVFSLCEDREYWPGQRKAIRAAYRQMKIKEKRVALEDHGEVPAESIERSVRKLTDWLRKPETVYLHCRAGQQRSATVAAALLCRLRSYSIEEARGELVEKRPSAVPLPHQLLDLHRWFEAFEQPARM